MMDRRHFMALSGVAGMASLGATAMPETEAGKNSGTRDYYLLSRYTFKEAAQVTAFETFMGTAAVPAYNRMGLQQVGVFQVVEPREPLAAYVLLSSKSLDTLAASTTALLADDAFLSAGANFLNAPVESPAYTRVETSLLMAFTGMPDLAILTKAEGRVLQLRIYESPSVPTNQKKIEMFNTAELAIFQKTGMNAVFFGEALAGSQMPNLTYMLGFDDMKQKKAAWETFLEDPDWLALRAKPEYADNKILCGITNIMLKPMACSQI